MVNFLLVDAVTDTTNTTFAYRLGPFGLQEFECTLSLPTSNGKSWTISTWTSDIVILIFTILVFTFAIDHYLFNSRYLVHIRGATRIKDRNLSLEEKAALHEKEALNVESGNLSNNENYDRESKAKHNSDPSSSTTSQTWRERAVSTLLTLFALSFGLYGSENPQKSSEHKDELPSTPSTQGGEKEEDVNKPLHAGRWSRFFTHPVTEKIFSYVLLILASLFMLAGFAFHIVFWPFFIFLFTSLERGLSEDTHLNVSALSIKLKFISYLAIWTIIGVTLSLKPSRFQGPLWKCLKWTHIINGWLFFGILYSHIAVTHLPERVGYNIEIIKLVLFTMRPPLIAYIFAGVVCNATVLVRVYKYCWYDDNTKF